MRADKFGKRGLTFDDVLLIPAFVLQDWRKVVIYGRKMERLFL